MIALQNKIEDNVYMDPNSGCWIWLRARTSKGYGSISTGSGHSVPTHRLAYEIYRGPIPKDRFVCHSCDTPPCCNPDHLFIGSCADNLEDMRNKNRHGFGERHGNAKLSDDQVISIRNDPRKFAIIAEEYGVRIGTIMHIQSDGTWKHLDIERRQILRSVRHKLTEDKVRAIRADTRKQREIALAFGVSQTLVGAILRREIWRDVP